MSAALLVSGVALARHVLVMADWPQYRPLLIAWTLTFGFAAVQYLLSWADRPVGVTVRQRRQLDRLQVVVNVPVYNEDPELLDRCICTLVNQTRMPDRIEIVDDGSDIDYTVLRAYWDGRLGIVRWVRQEQNAGKKHAQAVTFTGNPEADIFVTIDSDTALERSAIAEGLKPFSDSTVMSVAGIELAFNSRVNWLTRTVSARSLFFQIVACGAQSALGDILVNRGAFALYRAGLVRRIVPAYLGETFLGHPVRLGDDAALTLFARGSGRAVQQPTAFALTMYPERLSHHFRQWIRWMRGSTIRNCWRLRYLPVLSYGWIFTALGTYLFLASSIVPVLTVIWWHQSGPFLRGAVIATIAWGYLTGLRSLAVRRSDESAWYRLGTLASFPFAMVWAMLVLRPLRFWGIATCLRQGWTTRIGGVEVSMGNSQAGDGTETGGLAAPQLERASA